MTPHRHWVRNYSPLRMPIRLADNSIIYSSGVGTVVFNPVIGGKAFQLLFRIISSHAYISQNIRDSKFALIHTRWTSTVMVGHFSALQLGLQTVPTSLVPLNRLLSWPTGSLLSHLLSHTGTVAVVIIILQTSQRHTRKVW